MTQTPRPARARGRPDVPFEASGFFVFRTPLLSIGALERWGEDLIAARSRPEAFADGLASDRRTLVERLRRELLDPVVREAIFCASPSLDEGVEAWLQDPAHPRSAGVVEAVVRYFARMTARATPFGLFAGCSLGKIGDVTRLHLAPRSEARRHARLDMHYVVALVASLETDADVRNVLRYFPSSGLSRVAGQLRYAEAFTDAKTRERTYRLTSVEVSAALDLVLERAAGGATREELVRAVVLADPEIETGDVEPFVEEIIESQILVSELTPPITGEEPIHHVLRVLKERVPGHAAARVLEHVRDALAVLDREPLGVEARRYRGIAEDLGTLAAPVELPRLFQIDLVKPAPEARLGGAVLGEIERAVELLARLTLAREPDALATFRAAFSERYESREVRLCDVLDEETGIGFASIGSEPSPLFEGLAFPNTTEGAAPPDGRLPCLMRGLSRCLRAGAREWVLDDGDVAALVRKTPATLPDSFAVTCKIVAASQAALDGGDFRVALQGVNGPSGAKLFGRFCQGDPELAAAVSGHLRAEEALRPASAFAEIAHLPEGRIGNVICRPVFREHEIPYLGRSGAPAERQVTLDDLLVSVHGDRVVLRSERLGREVVPRLTNAHNSARSSLGIYRFLCALERGTYLGWDWGPVGGAPFLPRVSHGRLVLWPATWRLGERELGGLGKKGSADAFHWIQALRRELDLPRWICWVEGDHSLPIDLDNVLAVDAFVGAIRQHKSVSLEEMLPAPGEELVEGPEGRYTAEVVVPFVAKRAPAAAADPPSRPRAARSFLPGSEWLFVKLYTGTATADRVLTEIVAPIAREAVDSGHVDRWFFIRYGDPGWHLRLRFHGDPSWLATTLLRLLHDAVEPERATGAVSRMAIDTYEREIERYGGDRGIELAETIFHADSDASLRIVAACNAAGGADARWRLALLGMHRLLSDFRIELPERVALLDDARSGMGQEFGVDSAFQHQLDAKFRRERASLEGLLFGPPIEEGPIAEGTAAFEERSRRVPALADELPRSLLLAVASSHLHMHANRVLAGEARKQELVLYDLLFALYRSQLARARASKSRELV